VGRWILSGRRIGLEKKLSNCRASDAGQGDLVNDSLPGRTEKLKHNAHSQVAITRVVIRN